MVLAYVVATRALVVIILVDPAGYVTLQNLVDEVGQKIFGIRVAVEWTWIFGITDWRPVMNVGV